MPMKPDDSWVNDWRYGLVPEKEREVSGHLLGVFQDFWRWAQLDQKSKTTRQRYGGALHALGGWAVEQIAEGKASEDVYQLLVEATSGGDGPLIHLDSEEWQRELDMVCRKLYQFLVSQS